MSSSLALLGDNREFLIANYQSPVTSYVFFLPSRKVPTRPKYGQAPTDHSAM
jgi:hypothetical protein